MSSKTHSAGVASAKRTERGRLARLEDDHLAGLDVADVLGADDVERRRLRRQAPAGSRVVAAPQAVVGIAAGGARQPAQDERPEAERVAHADDPALVEDDQAVRAADARQDAAAAPRPCRRPARRRGARSAAPCRSRPAAAPGRRQLARAARGC